MYDDIIHLAMDQQLLTEIRDRNNENYKKLPLIKELQKFDDNYTEIEQQLTKTDEIKFDNIFHEPVGYHLIKEFLRTQHSVDKAIFLSDVELYKNLNDPCAREQVANKIFDTFCAPEINNRKKGQSVFKKHSDYEDSNDDDDDDDEQTQIASHNEQKMNQQIPSRASSDENAHLKRKDINDENYQLSLLTEDTNVIGVYGRPLKKLEATLSRGFPAKNVFDAVAAEVYDDLRLDVFPRFQKSNHYKMYLKCKQIERKVVSVKDFHQMRILGRGAFGMVNACKKKDTGKLYAMKQINKKRVQATDSLKTVMQERNYLAMMNSNFVTTLKYGIIDDTTIHIILDLMLGGDLKYHLNVNEKFTEDRARFHAAQVLLGLQHIHSKNIVYRDLKLENILLDQHGHCKVSDLGLAVLLTPSKDKVRGYAGTPGYTAPEVVLGFEYDYVVDFFSLGVMVYRCLCGRKPFERKRGRNQRHKDKRHRKSSALDRNVIEMEPEFPPHYFSSKARSILKGLMAKNPLTRLGYNGISQIKQHPWFDPIDFGLLEAGYLQPPFDAPKLEQVHSPIGGNDEAPPLDDQYRHIKITQEFEKQLIDFEFVSKETLQEELVEVLKNSDIKKIKNGYTNGINKVDQSNDTPYDIPQPKPNKCFGCNIL